MSDPPPYNDDDLVYVDPVARTVVAKVEFDEKGNPRMRASPPHYPWGTYRSMKRTFRVGGKVQEGRGQAGLDEVLPKLLNDTL